MSDRPGDEPTPVEVFDDPIVQLAAICPICALAALNPVAALAALSPVLAIFNPAINPRAAMLAFLLPPHAAVQAKVGNRLHMKMTAHAMKHAARGMPL